MCHCFGQGVQSPSSSSSPFFTRSSGARIYPRDSQKFWMTQNLVVGESLRVFKHKAGERGTKINANYELAMKDLISHSFPPKALQRHKRYLRRGLYKPRDIKIREFICCIDEMVKYLEEFPPFGAGQCLTEDYILELVELSPLEGVSKRTHNQRVRLRNPRPHGSRRVL